MKTRFVWVPMLLSATIALPGCRDAGGAPTVAEIRDSAGVRLVLNRGQVWTDDTSWKLGAPRLEVGGLTVDPEYQVYEVTGATRLGDGRVIVANNGTKELRYYDSSGAFLKSVGREGGGPGEFRHVWQFKRIAGDSLLIWDSGNRRLALHDADGTFIRTFKLEESSAAVARFPGMELVPFADGSLLGLEWMGADMMNAPPGVFRDSADFFLFDSEGREQAAVGSFPWNEMFVGREQVRMMNGRMMNQRGPLKFGKELHLASGRTTFWMTSGEPTLSRFDPSGRLLQLVRRADLDRIPVTPELVSLDLILYMAEEETHGHDKAALDRQERLRQEMPSADTVPAYRNLSVDASGNLWAERHPGVEDPGAPSTWDVFEESGRFLGSLELPPRFQVHEIGTDYVLGVRQDELDIEYLVMFELIK